MAKSKSTYVCSNCGFETVKWLGKCPSCNSWNSFVEEISSKSTDKQTISAFSNFSTGSLPKNISDGASSDCKEAWQEIIDYPHDNNLIDNIGNLSVMHNKLNSKLSNKSPREKIEFIQKNQSNNAYIHTKTQDDFNLTPQEDEDKNDHDMEEISWSTDNIINRANMLAEECYFDICAIGTKNSEGTSNFPSVSDQKLEKFK